MKEQYMKSTEELLKEWDTSAQGLNESQVTAHREKYGRNELPEGKKKSILILFLEQFKDFLVIILLAAALISGFLGDIESALVILLVVTMNAVLGTVQNKKAEQSLNSLKSLSAPTAKVLRDGTTRIIPACEVVGGDILLLEAGDSVSADGRIIENASMKINESALTGESVTVEKDTAIIDRPVPIGDRKNMVFSGSFVTYGRGKFLVTGVGTNTEIGKIASLLKNTQEKKTPLQVNLDRFGKKLSIIILCICAVLFITGILRGDDIFNAFMFSVALAVAAIPEALSSIVTIVLSFGTQKLAKENAIIRKLQAVEGLGSVSIICSDKTGTLTQNKMTIKKVFTDDGINEENSPLFPKFLLMSVLCNDATNTNGEEIGDPTEVAFVNYADHYYQNCISFRTQYPRLAEIPFDSDRKLMSTVHRLNDKTIMITKGATDVLLPLLCQWETKNGPVPVTEQHRALIAETNHSFSEQGLRVLAFAYREISSYGNLSVEDEKGYTFLGLAAMIDPPREESKAAVATCIAAGIKPIMITGDHKITAAAIAKEIGICKDDNEAVEGMAIDSMTDEELLDYVPKISVYARVSPENKIRIVRAWQNRGNIVAMTGDGVNDAPALKQADVGVAMGITGSEVAKDAASMVLTDDNFATIVKAVENGRNIYANIKRSIQFLLSGNAAGILVVLYASLFGLPVPFAPVHLLFINLLTDSLPAIALGLEPHNSQVMKEKPRPKDENILTKGFLQRVAAEGFVMSLLTIAAYHIGLSQYGPGGACTLAFATLCLSRLIHGFNCKSKKPVLFTRKFLNNKFLIGAFAAGFVMLNAVLLIPGLHRIFNVTALDITFVFIIYGLALANLFITQIIKKILVTIN